MFENMVLIVKFFVINNSQIEKNNFIKTFLNLTRAVFMRITQQSTSRQKHSPFLQISILLLKVTMIKIHIHTNKKIL